MQRRFLAPCSFHRGSKLVSKSYDARLFIIFQVGGEALHRQPGLEEELQLIHCADAYLRDGFTFQCIGMAAGS